MPVTAFSDAELLDQARHGGEAAFTELYVRHQPAALRLASTYRRSADPEDLVNEAFEKVLAAVRRGGGPTESFRAYLFVTLRRLAAEHAERPSDEPLDDVPEPVVAEAAEPGMERADRDIMSSAFESLPDRWQAVLWHTAVEGRAPRELAPALDVSANAAAALSYRAREKLRQAYLQAHLLASPHPECEPHRSRLGAYVRGGLRPRVQAATERHVESCGSCSALVAELTDVNRLLARSLLPLFLVGHGAEIAAVGGAAAGAAGGAAAGGAKRLWGRVREFASSPGGAIAAAAVAGGLALAVVAVTRDNGPGESAGGAAGTGESPPPRFVPGPSDPPETTTTALPFGGFEPDSPGRFGAQSPLDTEGPAPPPAPAPTTEPAPLPAAPAPSPPPPGPSGSPTPPPPPPLPSEPPPSEPPAAPPPPSDPPDEPEPPAPTPLAFAGPPTWTPTAVGRGELTVRIGEAETAVALASAGDQQAQADAGELRIDLSAEVEAVADGLDPACAVTGAAGAQRIDCVLDPRAPALELVIPLRVGAAGQTATLTLHRNGTVEDSASVALEPYEEGLGLVPSAWGPVARPGFPPRSGMLTVGGTHGGNRPLPGVSVEVALAGDAGFLPARPGASDLVPEGCTAHDSSPPGGLADTMVCDLGELAPGDTQSRDLIVMVRPDGGGGGGEVPTATVTLRLQDPADPSGEPAVIAVESVSLLPL